MSSLITSVKSAISAGARAPLRMVGYAYAGVVVLGFLKGSVAG